jgi:perosamine synthetase
MGIVSHEVALTEIRIPLAKPDISDKEIGYAADAVRSTWISSKGEYVTRFEHDFAELCGVKWAVAVCNGTAALHLAMLVSDLGEDDEVILPSLTFIATANAVRYVGATPVFVDVDPETWCLDPDLIADSLTSRTKAILAVHLYGHPADMDPINALARAAGLSVVEDAAEAHFAEYKRRPAGSLAPIACFSFYGNKPITAGEGGIVLMDAESTYERVKLLRGQGMDPDRQYFFPVIGYNYRMTNIAAAIACAQIARKDELMQKREVIFHAYRENLKGVPGIGLQPVATWAKPAPWLFSILVDEDLFGHSRQELMTILGERGVETRPFFIPIHTLPPYRGAAHRKDASLPVTERLAATGLNLPTFSQMTMDEVDFVSETIIKAAR